jgi:hypothetical protein
MACDDILDWVDKVQDKIDALDRAAAVQKKREAAIKSAITGLAKAMQSLGLTAELGIDLTGPKVKIAVSPKHVETVTGIWEAWDGWEKYEHAGGTLPTPKATRALLLKARKVALDQYQRCHEAEGWTGHITATFTEHWEHKPPGEINKRDYEEVHAWTITGKNSDGSEEQTYKAKWHLKATGSYELKEVRQHSDRPDRTAFTTLTLKPTTVSLNRPSQVDIAVTGNKYEIVCGVGTNYFPSGFAYTEHVTNTDPHVQPEDWPLSEDLSEHIVTLRGSLGSGGEISGTKEGPTNWNFWVLPGAPGKVRHRLKTEWSLQRTP